MRSNSVKPIQMLEKRFAWFPHHFVANGQRFTVTAVECCETLERKYRFIVKCGAERFSLLFDFKTGRWSMEIPK